MALNTAIIAMTDSNSISVKPFETEDMRMDFLIRGYDSPEVNLQRAIFCHMIKIRGMRKVNPYQICK